MGNLVTYMRMGIALLALAFISSTLIAKPAQSQARLVMVAGNGDFDACLSTSFIKKLKPNSFLSVRAGPSLKAKETARLPSGDAVWNCDAAGVWVGIVYNPNQRSPDEGLDCDLGPSDTPRRPYRGDCQSGWVHGSYLLNLAG
jgi:hypothetical protein